MSAPLGVVLVGNDRAGRAWADRVARRRDLTAVRTVEATPDPAAFAGAEAAIVAGPVAARAAAASAALDAGLAVLVEPPLALTLAGAAAVRETARRRGRPVAIALPDRHAAWRLAVGGLIRAGRIGEITHVSLVDSRVQDDGPGVDWQAPCAQLSQAGVQHLDSLCDLVGGRPASVMARLTTAPWSRFAHGSTSEVIVAMADGLRVHYHGSLTANLAWHALWIDGTAGVLWTDRRRIWWRPRRVPRFLPLPRLLWRPGDGTSEVIDRFVAAATAGGGGEPASGGGLRSVALLEAAMASDAGGRVAAVAGAGPDQGAEAPAAGGASS
ncbi:MAG: Gfo/Idh/MocA family oxidoreductase [Vicinamibacterales bacterium]